MSELSMHQLGKLCILEAWFNEPGREVLKERFIANKNLEESDENLALKKCLCGEAETMPKVSIEITNEQVLRAEEIKKEYSVISESLLMRKLKCSYPQACALMKRLGTAD